MDIDIIVTDADTKVKMDIVHAVDRNLDELSVSQICENSHVSRPTFYKHFASKYVIAEWYDLFCMEHYLNKIGRTLSWREGLVKHHLMLEKEKNLFLFCSLKADKQATTSLEWMIRHRVEVLVETLRTNRDVEPDAGMLFLVSAYARMEQQMGALWCVQGMVPEAEVFATYLEECVPRRLYDALQLHPGRTCSSSR